jgi:hypothetical protein
MTSDSYPKVYRDGDQLIIDHGAPHREHPGGILWGRWEIQHPIVVTSKWRRQIAKFPPLPKSEQDNADHLPRR